MAILKNYLVIS